MSLTSSEETQTRKFREALELEAEAYGVQLDVEALKSLSKYYDLLQAWNRRLHLVAPCSPKEFATRHILESLLLLQYFPTGARVADVGSGAGLPIIPCLIVRPDIQAVLIESAKKKAVFLREALNRTATSARASVIAERFEDVRTAEAEFVTCRALERFEEMLPELFKWAPGHAVLLLFGGERLGGKIKSSGFVATATLIPNSQKRFLYVVTK
jgi:16S rRNA (guanine527-N7)-methyltransferase